MTLSLLTMSTSSLALAAALLIALPAAAQDPLCPGRFIDGAFVETSTGPYDPGDTFEATLMLSTPQAGEDMGASTMALDYNRAAMTYAEAPIEGTDYEWLLFDGRDRNTVDGNVRNYTSTVRVTSESRLVPFVDLEQESSGGTAFGEALPTSPTAALRMRWTVVDATEGIVVSPESQQWYNGPGGLNGCYSTGTWTGLEVGQQTVSGTGGWRMLAAPATGLTPDGLSVFNHLQGIPGYFPDAGANLYTGYDGTLYGRIGASDAAFTPGLGVMWQLYDAADFPGTPPPSYQPLPMTLRHAGVSAAALVAGGEIGADAARVALHADGDSWNLLGNPFATGLDVTQLAPVGGSLASVIAQVWDPAGGTYRVSTELGGRIAGWQGFFLENDDATALDFPTEARMTGATLLARPDHVITFTLDGTVGDTETLDRALVLALDDEAQPGWDPHDARKLTPLGASYAVLAFVGTRDGASVLKAQDARPLSSDGFATGLALDVAGGDAALTLRWSPEALPEDVSFRLRDTQTGDLIDLHEQSAYAFSSASMGAARNASAPSTTLMRAQERFVLAVGRPAPVAGEGGAEAFVLDLATPFPNPAHAQSTVRFTVPEAGPVRVSVLDMLGRTVAILADGEQSAGAHQATLDASRLASGLYIVRLDAGTETRTQRLTVVR